MEPTPDANHLLHTLNQEAQSHHVTKTMLSRFQSSSHAWERSCLIAQTELYTLQRKLAAAETKVQQLSAENARLNLMLSHLVGHTLEGDS